MAWQYAPDAWAVLAGEPHADTFPPADQVKIAERFAVGTGAPVVAKVPFRTDYPPGGFALQSVSGQSLTTEHPAARRGQPHQPVQPGQHWCATTLPGGEFYVAVEDPSNPVGRRAAQDLRRARLRRYQGHHDLFPAA